MITVRKKATKNETKTKTNCRLVSVYSRIWTVLTAEKTIGTISNGWRNLRTTNRAFNLRVHFLGSHTWGSEKIYSANTAILAFDAKGTTHQFALFKTAEGELGTRKICIPLHCWRHWTVRTLIAMHGKSDVAPEFVYCPHLVFLVGYFH